jgi:3-oxoacyl-[acyl-carrier-protein] synthase-3
MSQCTLRNVRFAGMATCVPKRVFHNINDAPPKIRSERERLARNIGIYTRRLCPEWQTFSDLAFEAAEKLLVELNWNKADIDALIIVSQSPDYLIPATAIILQDRLQLQQTTIAYDVNLGCSGYPFGLHLMASMIASGAIKKGLLLVGDRAGEEKDPLFSDAGTATALEFAPNAPPMYFDLNSDGSGYKAIMLPVGGHRAPTEIGDLIEHRDEAGYPRCGTDLILDGPAVLSFSTQRVPPAVEALLNHVGMGKDEIDYFVFHQANKMINETIRKKLRLPEEKVPSTLHDFGNTSGASLPVTMTARLRDALSQGHHRLLLCGFGIGLSWGAAIVDIDSGVFPALIEA